MKKLFTKINYQYIVEHLIEPLLNRQDGDEQSKILLKNYLSSLSFSKFDNSNSPLNIETIMAMTTEEKELLVKFWNDNQDLLRLALQAKIDFGSDGNEREDYRSQAMNLDNQSTKDFAKYTLQDSSGTILRDRIGKGPLVEAVIKHYCENHDGLTLTRLQEIFPKALQRRLDVVTFEPRSFRDYFAPVVNLEGRELYICRQWGKGSGGIDNTQYFIDKARALGYKIERIES